MLSVEVLQKDLVLLGFPQHLVGFPLPAHETSDFQAVFCPDIKHAEMAFCVSFVVSLPVALWLQDMRALTAEGEAGT